MNHQNAPPFPLISRNACNGQNGKNGEKSPASDNLSWMPNVPPWRLAILAKNVPAPWRLAIRAKLAILPKIARGLAMMAKNVPAPWRLAIWAKMEILGKIAIGLSSHAGVFRGGMKNELP